MANAGALAGKKVAMLATHGVEQVELLEPKRALEAAGAEVHVIAPEGGTIQGMNHDEKGDLIAVDRTLDDVSAGDYAALVLPGGVANPDTLRTDERAVALVKEFVDGDRPVAAICHGPWLLVEAGVLKGRTLTSWPSLKTDIANAGGDWVDAAVHVDQQLVTSRKPEDIPQFNEKLLGLLRAGPSSESSLDRMVEATFPASDPIAPQSGRG